MNTKTRRRESQKREQSQKNESGNVDARESWYRVIHVWKSNGEEEVRGGQRGSEKERGRTDMSTFN